MKERVITAIILIAVVAIGLFQSAEFLKLLIAAVILLGSYEAYDIRKKDSKPYILGIIIVLVGLSGYLGMASLTILMGVTIMAMFSCSVFDEVFTFDHVMYFSLMTTMLMIANVSVHTILGFGKLVFLFVLIATYATDTFALFGGKFFGKRKLIERISPKKTVEGAVVGYVSSVILSLTYGFVVLDGVDKRILIISALIMPILSQIGDLAFSLIKRHFGIKDFGKIFPGHGGVLDRIDSLIFAMITFLIITQAIALL